MPIRPNLCGASEGAMPDAIVRACGGQHEHLYAASDMISSSTATITGRVGITDQSRYFLAQYKLIVPKRVEKRRVSRTPEKPASLIQPGRRPSTLEAVV